MMLELIISISAFVGVAALVGAVALMFRGQASGRTEGRLDLYTDLGARGKDRDQRSKASLLTEPVVSGANIFGRIVARISKLRLLFEQADTTLNPSSFFLISGTLGAAAWGVAWFLRAPVAVLPFLALMMGSCPLLWLIHRRRARFKKFAAQLPDALELVGRALRAGHSLAAGFDLVRDEMAPPIGSEFGRVFEEQNLGLPLDEALKALTDRVPNLDLKFFATAVILQRQTGGDLAEILDKISYLIRERFKIYGQVQALTGEGRLSGVVLLALPPALFAAVFYLNHDYIMTLFTDPMGKKMLAVALFLQLLGALVIRKIVNIKV